MKLGQTIKINLFMGKYDTASYAFRFRASESSAGVTVVEKGASKKEKRESNPNKIDEKRTRIQKKDIQRESGFVSTCYGLVRMPSSRH